jgi:acyl-coenzyme A synthetase/AMP-(fatty) acid ligase
MSHLGFLRQVLRESGPADALIWRDGVYSHVWLAEALDGAGRLLREAALPDGAVVSLEADFSPTSVATLLALIERGAIVVPLTESVSSNKPEFRETAEVEWIVTVDEADRTSLERTGRMASHTLLTKLKQARHPGLVLFSSGSTGKSKAALHDLVPMLEKFAVKRQTLRSITFLLFDHIGGFNTLMYNLANGGCCVTVEDRRPETVCRAIAQHRVELLPTSPTFLNLLLVSEAYKRFDLSTLKIVTYGTEVMPQSTLDRFHQLFPDVRLQQTYGLSEIGIMRSKSRSSDSLWVKIGGEGFETRVVDGLLEVKARSAMLGYLNAPSPFTADGWFMTGDAVEVDGEYFRILGRQSEIINVGGQKVYPAEVESVLQTMDGVEEVVVSGERSPMLGQIVRARVKLSSREELGAFRKRMHAFCRDKLQVFKIPQKVELVSDPVHSERFKKIRRNPL